MQFEMPPNLAHFQRDQQDFFESVQDAIDCSIGDPKEAIILIRRARELYRKIAHRDLGLGVIVDGLADLTHNEIVQYVKATLTAWDSTINLAKELTDDSV